MKSKITKINDVRHELHIEIPKEHVDSAFEEIISEYKKEAKIPGFRPGKAPLDIVVKNYGKAAMEEAQRRVIPEAYQKALDKHNMEPISYPDLSDVECSMTGEVKFKAQFDVHPAVNIKKYKGIKITSEKIGVKEKEVEEALERIQNMNAEFKDIERELKHGDFGVCAVETHIDGKVVSAKRDNMWIEVNKEASFLGMGEELTGLKKGDKKDIEVTLPENYGDDKFAGKKAIFKLIVKETKEKELPELNDELAKKIGKETIKDVRSEIKDQLLLRKEENNNIKLKNQILEFLIEKNKMDVPESMVKRQLKVLVERAENDLLQKGVDKKIIEQQKEEIENKLKKEAEDKVRVYFLLDDIAKQEKIEIADSEIDKWYESMASHYSKEKDEVKKNYESNNLVEGLKEQLREEKILNFLVEEAEISGK